MLLSEWQLPGGGYLIISELVIHMISEYRQIEPSSTEAGGIFLGYRRGPHLEVVTTTIPGPKDIRRRTYFERCDPSHQRVAIEAWERDPYIHYLGEWHTHPERHPSPSMLDRREWMILGKEYRNDKLAMLIVGQESSWLGVQQCQACHPCAMNSLE